MSIASAVRAAPDARASTRSAEAPAKVKTVRSWSTSECWSSSSTPAPNAVRNSAMRATSLPCETFGTASSRGATLEEQLALAHDLFAVDRDGRLEDHAVEVDRHLHIAADRRRRADGNVRGAEDLLVLEDVASQRRL